MTREEFAKAMVEKGEAMRAAAEKADQERVWRGCCRKCRQMLSGTLAQLKEHECDGAGR